MVILDEATALGSRRMFLTGIYLAHELVDAPIPANLVTIARGDRAVRALAGRVAEQLFRMGEQPGAIHLQYRLQQALHLDACAAGINIQRGFQLLAVIT